MADGQVVFEISADPTKAKNAINQTTKALEQAGKDWEDSAEGSTAKIGGSFADMFKKIGLAAAAAKVANFFLDFGKAAVDAASDLEEVQNVVDVTFGDGASQIQAWANTARTQFGLTEIQAKKFTSTLGAMMKSAGLAGPEIVSMSTDLAGLAADMASFYNLDFETAFQKIRSGISGETEPLKQLGINMSVANLEAYALSKGIEMAFDKMSQSEQTMLRYQYLMQATADAQGDFARTSDGYANTIRSIETSFESIKTSVGKVLLPAVQEAAGYIDDLIKKMMPDEDFHTVLDEFNAIQLDTDQKLEDIATTKAQADLLIGVLEDINRTTIGNGVEQSLTGIASALTGVNDATGAATKQNSATTIRDILNAFNNDTVNGDNAKAWDTLLASLKDNIYALSDFTGQTPDDIANWLTQMGVAANTLDPNSAEGWSTLMSLLIQGLPGLTLDEEGDLDTSALTRVSQEADQYSQYLASLGIATDGVTDTQQLWLEICRRLVQVIPGLSEIINLETGEIEGGTEALRTWVDEWEAAQRKTVLLNDISRRRQALDEMYSGRYELEADLLVAQARLKTLEDQWAGYSAQEINQANAARASHHTTDHDKEILETYKDLLAARDAVTEAEEKYNKYVEDYDKAVALIEEQRDAVVAAYGEEALAVNEVTTATQALTQEGEELAAETMQNLAPALEKLADYYEDVYNATQRQVDGIIGGFEKIQTPAQKAREEFKKLHEELSGDEFEIRFAAEGNVPSAQSMLAGLESQAEYIRQYQEYLNSARAAGVNEDLLAELSDGSTESYDYLAALAGASEEQIQAINDAYADVSSGKETFVDALTQQKLAADETFQAIVNSCDQMIIDLDMADGAYDSLSATVEGMANGIADKLPDLTAQVDAVIAQLSRLNSTGRFGMVGDRFTFGASGRILDGSFAGGADYIPFDGFLAQLHEGESVLKAEEARVWRTFKYGAAASSNNIDYDALGSTIGANVHAGGSVYLDSAVVGRVISNGQANAYRQLERSGWQK